MKHENTVSAIVLFIAGLLIFASGVAMVFSG
ncbi:hypothetical protein BN439_3849 [Erwinia amylovora Ea644]|nr:hypothetical protein EHX00_3558 [Erwinia amylovora]CCP04872.1 hypothetical protein BN439_3849 [Erwinia amylovora Ea644]CDK16884.1 hypothetical protein LA635_3260 [Erwinia amylovora LA635]CDK20252.1 hypothetical protein LA636_3260 [Erwinia amylovora LA636]CDK23623.1 hypothetical protein LA637_3263 [Erwinia amylovora LA637]